MDFTRGAPSGPPVTIAWACIKRSICKRAASHPAGTRGARAPTGQTRKKGAVETLFWSSSPDEGAPAPDRPRAHPGDWTVVAIALGDTLVPPEGRGQSWRCPAGSRVPRIAPRGGIQQTRKKETYRSRDASGYGSGSSNRKRRSILSESCRDIRQPWVPGEKGPGPISSEYLLRDRPETREADQFHPGSQKDIFGDTGGIGVRRYGAAIPGGRGADPVEYVLLQVYELLTVRCESERTRSIVGAAQPADPAHI